MLDEPARTARRLLGDGVKVPDVEKELVRQGLEPAAAARVVDEVLRGKVADAAAQQRRPFSIVRVLAGLALAAASFVGIYLCFAQTADALFRPIGAWRGAVRGAVIGGLAGLAIGALNRARSELMRLWQGGD